MHLMTTGDLSREIAEFTYRPGWRLSVYEDAHLGPMLRIVASVPDGYHPEQVTDLGISSRIPPCARLGPRRFGEWLLWRLEETEIHECREFLRYRGELVSDPHKDV